MPKLRHSYGIVLALLLLTACGPRDIVIPPATSPPADADLLEVARWLGVTANTIGEIQTSVIEAYKLKLVSDDGLEKTITLTRKVNTAGKAANGVVRKISKLAPADRTSLTAILKPIAEAVDESLLDVLGIENPKTKQNVQVLLTTLKTALATALLIIKLKEANYGSPAGLPETIRGTLAWNDQFVSIDQTQEWQARCHHIARRERYGLRC